MKILSVTVPIFTTNFESDIKIYEKLVGEPVHNKFEVPDKGFSVARIGHFLLIGGTEEILAPLRQIRATLSVDSLDEYDAHLRESGATILQPPSSTPTGKNMIAMGADGVVFEYVELAHH
jgi:predicted enzyme related to lactoylglutathione lyase